MTPLPGWVDKPGAPARLTSLAMVHASMGGYGEAADMLESIPPGDIAAPFAKDAARLLRTAPAKAAAPLTAA
jgi:hypothetical protein